MPKKRSATHLLDDRNFTSCDGFSITRPTSQTLTSRDARGRSPNVLKGSVRPTLGGEAGGRAPGLLLWE